VAQEVLEKPVADGGWAEGAWQARPWAGGSVVDGAWLGGLSDVEYSADHLIDLGEPGRDFAPLETHAPRRLRVAATMALCCLFVLSGATPTTANHPVLLWTVQTSPDAQLSTSGGTLFVVPEGSAPTVTAIDLATGRAWWHQAVPWTPERFVDVGGGVDAVVVRTTTVDSREGPRMNETLYIRRADGHILAEANGAPLGRAGRLLLQVVYGKCPDGSSLSCAEVFAMDLGASRTAWRLSLGEGGRVLADSLATGDRFITASADGTLTLRSVDTDAPLETVPGRLSGGGGVRLSAIVGDVVIIGAAGTEQSTLVAYRASTLQRLWAVSLTRDPGPREVDTSLVQLDRCGYLACVADGGGTAVLDPATGALRFRTDLRIVSQVDGGAFVAVPFLGHLDTVGRYVSDVLAIDPTTGRQVTSIASATFVDAGADVTLPTALIRRNGQGGSQFAAIDAQGAGTSLLTVIGSDLRCVQRPHLLACVDETGVLRAWRV
jgi:outer membrane protein assembly factor BamB